MVNSGILARNQQPDKLLGKAGIRGGQNTFAIVTFKVDSFLSNSDGHDCYDFVKCTRLGTLFGAT